MFEFFQPMNTVCFSISLGSAERKKERKREGEEREGGRKEEIGVLGYFSNYVDEKLIKQHIVYCRCILSIAG